MQLIDINHFYKYTLQYLVANKYSHIKNYLSLPRLKKIFYFFQLSHISDLDDPQIYNYVYLFKYFFGKRAFLTKIKSFFNVGIWSYSLRVSLFIIGKEANMALFLISYFLRKADKRFIKSSIFNKLLKVFYIQIADLNIFTERKTNLGLFYVEQPLNIHLHFTGFDVHCMRFFLKNYKLKC